MSFAAASDSPYLPDETVPVIPPAPAGIFEKRAARLRALASGNVVSDYLEAMARLAEAQHTAAQVIHLSSDPHSASLLSFNVRDHNQTKNWQKALEIIISEMQFVPLPDASQAALLRLKEAEPEDLEIKAQTILFKNHNSIDLAASPFLAAALQVYWTNLASGIQVKPMECTTYACPACGSPPVAGIVQTGRKLRYLCCSLCATHWYVPRVTCTSCGDTSGLSYFTIDGGKNGIKAEACNQCKTYLKLFYLENNPEADAFADDLATLPLDLLMSDESYCRGGVNLFLLSDNAPGQEPAQK